MTGVEEGAGGGGGGGGGVVSGEREWRVAGIQEQP